MALLDRSSALMTTSAARGRDLPRAAVEIIARLSAERGRLRDEVARLRSELRQAPQPEALVQLRAERDALARQLADAHHKLSQQNTSGAFQRLQGRQVEALGKLAERLERALNGLNDRAASFDRLERAVARLEEGSRAPAGASAPAPQRERAAPQSPSRTTRPMPRSGGGLLGNLVRANVALRGGEEESARTRAAGASARPEPAPQPAPKRKSAPRRPKGGGLLGNLVNQNLGLRRRGTSSH
jgi:hypothetical protein